MIVILRHMIMYHHFYILPSGISLGEGWSRSLYSSLVIDSRFYYGSSAFLSSPMPDPSSFFCFPLTPLPLSVVTTSTLVFPFNLVGRLLPYLNLPSSLLLHFSSAVLSFPNKVFLKPPSSLMRLSHSPTTPPRSSNLHSYTTWPCYYLLISNIISTYQPLNLPTKAPPSSSSYLAYSIKYYPAPSQHSPFRSLTPLLRPIVLSFYSTLTRHSHTPLFPTTPSSTPFSTNIFRYRIQLQPYNITPFPVPMSSISHTHLPLTPHSTEFFFEKNFLSHVTRHSTVNT